MDSVGGKRSVLIMAGGTGGHVFPGLAVAEELRAQGWVVAWLGTKAGIEAELVPARDISLHTLSVEGLRGKGVLSLLKAPWMLAKSLWSALAIVRKVQPACVLGMGGYASGPGAVAARLLGTPVLLHEQNAIAGTTNTLVSKMATRILQAFPGTFASGAKVFTTGNPVRAGLTGSMPAVTDSERKVLIVGGSRGAVALNEKLPPLLAQLVAKTNTQLRVRHQCGKGRSADVAALYQSTENIASVDVSDFIDDMAAAYAWADLVICRAGAMTVSELAMAGRASVLVPFPFAIDDHQTANARFLSDADAALLIQQDDLTAEQSLRSIAEILHNPQRLQAMASNAASVAVADAAQQVAAHCVEVSDA